MEKAERSKTTAILSIPQTYHRVLFQKISKLGEKWDRTPKSSFQKDFCLLTN
jgi:hypothetical protein